MSQKNKNTALVMGLVVIALLGYVFGISKTVDARKQLKILKQQQQLYKNAPLQLANLVSKEKALDRVLNENNLNGLSLQNSLLEVLNNESKQQGFTIVSFNEPHRYIETSTQSTTSTYQFQLQGTFNALIQVIYNLEQKYTFGNVVHFHFEKQKKYRATNQQLNCTIFLQRIY